MILIKNIIANYCGRSYAILIGVAFFPLYLQYLSPAAFGLISLYPLMQSCLSMLDMGLTQTLSREVAFYRHDDSAYDINQLLRSLEIIFFIIFCIIILSLIFSSHWLAHVWLQVDGLTYSDVIFCIIIMGVMVSLRLFSDLYRSGILGLEQQVWINTVNIILVTLQYMGGYILVRWFTQNPIHFFEYQLFISIIEFILLKLKFYKIFPPSRNYFLGFTVSWNVLKKIFPFAISVFYTSIIWTLLTQIDKLILSHILPLSTYGYFTLITIISNGILQLTVPISQALLPRMSHLLSHEKKNEMLRLYRNATQVMAVIMITVSGIIALFGSEIIYVWTGDKMVGKWAAPILFWYVLGSGFLSLSAFQYYLQFTYGSLKLHAIFNTIFALISAPFIIFSAYYYGPMGTGITWFLMQSVAFLIWPPIVHAQFAPGIHYQWLFKDIFPILFIIVTILGCIKYMSIGFGWTSRSEVFIVLNGIALIVLTSGILASKTCREFFITHIWHMRK